MLKSMLKPMLKPFTPSISRLPISRCTGSHVIGSEWYFGTRVTSIPTLNNTEPLNQPARTMRFQRLLTLSSVIGASLALELSNGAIRTPGGDSQFTASTVAAPVTFDSVSSKLDISFDLAPKKIPDQVFIKLTNGQGVETSYKPVIKVLQDSVTAKFTLSYSKLPKLFTKEATFDISIIAADGSDDAPIFTKAGSVQLTPDLIAESTYIKPERFGPKPEIHHIFQSAPSEVDSTIAGVFASLSIVCFFVLLAAWAAEGAINFSNFSATPAHLAFIGLIIGYEVVFFQYYLGSSIFDTIYKVALLTGPAVWFGSRVLNYVGALRLAGKR